MKSVLISISPKWCELIASGKKTIELRKTRPKIETPFKCYIYCTKQKTIGEILLTYDKKVEGRNKGFRDNGDIPIGGKVIGEFTCDRIEDWQDDAPPPVPLKDCCLTYSEVRRYGGTTETLYLWHISDLKIYDEPKTLGSFMYVCRNEFNEQCCDCRNFTYDDSGHACCDRRLSRPPQSWCYVEELT